LRAGSERRGRPAEAPGRRQEGDPSHKKVKWQNDGRGAWTASTGRREKDRVKTCQTTFPRKFKEEYGPKKKFLENEGRKEISDRAQRRKVGKKELIGQNRCLGVEHSWVEKHNKEGEGRYPS